MRFSRILIVRACAIGDYVLNLPALRALAQRSPEARFTLVGYPEYLEVAKPFIPVEAIHSIEAAPWSSLFAGPLNSFSALRFDAAFVWMKDPAFAENLRLSGVPYVMQAAAFHPGAVTMHAADHLLRTIGCNAPTLPDLWEAAPGKIIVHPGSGSPKKCWPFFNELLETISNAVVLMGPCEKAFRTRAPRLDELSLLQVVDELRNCTRFIGNDSGITHLAAYLGCPTIALFGPTDPRVWGPVGRRVDVLWKSRLEDISVADVRKLL